MATVTAPQLVADLNTQRADLGRRSLAARGVGEVSRDEVIDAITDILHAADRLGIATTGVIDVAGENFEGEFSRSAGGESQSRVTSSARSRSASTHHASSFLLVSACETVGQED